MKEHIAEQLINQLISQNSRDDAKKLIVDAISFYE